MTVSGEKFIPTWFEDTIETEFNWFNGDCMMQLYKRDEVIKYRNEALRDFVKEILHGDSKHKAWLLQAVEDYIEGKPIRKEGE